MMSGKKFYDPYAELLNKFNLKGVRYVVVGMSGINYYAKDAKEIFATADFDIFVKPTIANIKKSFFALKELEYNLMAGEEIIKESSLKDIVKRKKTILAVNSYGITFKLILSVSGYTFAQMEMDAAVFAVSDIPIKVARLSKLLISKRLAGREKDKLFLKRFELLLKERGKL